MNELIENDLREEQKQGFVINSIDTANWALKKLRAIEEKQSEIISLADSEIERINQWKERELSKYKSCKEHFEGLLTEYYLSERAKDKRFRLSTPYGKVSSRKIHKWIYEDESQLLNYLKENNSEAIKVKEEIDKSVLKKIFKNGVNQDTGELLHGVRVEQIENVTIKAE